MVGMRLCSLLASQGCGSDAGGSSEPQGKGWSRVGEGGGGGGGWEEGRGHGGKSTGQRERPREQGWKKKPGEGFGLGASTVPGEEGKRRGGVRKEEGGVDEGKERGRGGKTGKEQEI